MERLGLVSVVALMLLTGIRGTDMVTDVVTDMVIGILGSNITLKFTFIKHYKLDNIGLYYGNLTKVAQCMQSNCSRAFTINASMATVFYHMTNLSLRDSQVYYVSLYTDDVPPPVSNRVHLLVREDNKTTTGSPPPSASPDPGPSSAVEDSGASHGLPSALLLGAVVCPLLLLAVALPAVSWCLLRNKEPVGHDSQDRLPTVDERVSTMVSTCESSPSSVVYSVLDFPQRAPPTVPDMNSDTTYATISYPPEATHV